MYCPKCGTENLDNAQACHACGAQLPPPLPPAGGIVPKTSGLAIAAFVLAVVSFVLFPVGLVAIILGIAGIIVVLYGALTRSPSTQISGLILFGAAIPLILEAKLIKMSNRIKDLEQRLCRANGNRKTCVGSRYADDDEE